MRLLAAAGMALALAATPALAEHHAENHAENHEDDGGQDARTEEFASLPYWPGYWVSEFQVGTTISGVAPTIIDEETGEPVPYAQVMALRGTDAPWSEEGQRRNDEARARAGGRKALGWGYPMMMNAATPLAFVITPELTLIVNAYNETRYIYTDGRGLPDELDMWPTTWGTSAGHWEGDVLVIETVMVKDPSLFFHGAPSFSEDARYVERIHLEGDRLVSDMTITDPASLAEPWNVTVSWVRDTGYDRMIQIDWDNDRTGNDGELNTIEAEAVEE